jgi:tetratricopeptide (TPR) repeat protein
MGKKKVLKGQKIANETTKPEPVKQLESSAPINLTYLKLALIAVCILLYGNTLYNEYCLDDAIVITKNSVTQRGFAGIPDHLTHDYVYGFFNRPFNSALSPWRPLSLLTFSLEVGFFGMDKPWIGHLVNVLLYTLTVVLIFSFLAKYLFRDTMLSFIAALLFAIHPIHTEVVANIKSRDEILALLFLVLTMQQLWKHLESGHRKDLYTGLIFYFLALLSKENALTFVIGIPITMYFFTRLDRSRIFRYGYILLGVAILFFIIRISIVPLNPGAVEKVNILSHPYAYAQGSEAYFTKIYLLLRYLKLLFIPYPLVYDYSYNAIPFVGADSILVWVSVLVHLGLLAYALMNFRSKGILAFCVLMYFISFSLSSNIILPIAVIIGERLLYTPSVFFCIGVAYGIKKLGDLLLEKKKVNPLLVIAFIILPVFVLSSVIVIARNRDWKNNDSLNLSALKYIPESYKVNDGVAFYYMNKAKDSTLSKAERDSLNRQAIYYYERAIRLVPDLQVGLINVGVCYYRLGDVPSAEKHWLKLKQINPGYSGMKKINDDLAHYYVYKGIGQLDRKVYDSAEVSLIKGREYAATNDSLGFLAWYNSALLYNTTKRYPEAIDALGRVLKIRPDFQPAREGYKALSGREW